MGVNDFVLFIKITMIAKLFYGKVILDFNNK